MGSLKELLVVEKENLNEVFFRSLNINGVNYSELMGVLETLICTMSKRDNITITLHDVYDDEKKIISLDEKKSNFIEELESECRLFVKHIELTEEEFFLCDVYLSKSLEKQNDKMIISIYCADKFINFLTKTDDLTRKLYIQEKLEKYRNYFSEKDCIYFFEMINDHFKLETSKFIFTDNLNKSIEETPINETEEISIISEYSNVSFIPFFSPDSFYVRFSDNADELNIEFSKLCLLLSVCYMSNIAILKNEDLEVRLEGQKPIIEKFDFSKLELRDQVVHDFYSIYHWIYANTRGIQERIGIARNIITLFFNGTSIFDNSEIILPSIKSNFEIYLKENVDRYIQVLNNVVILLKDLNRETSEKTAAFSEKFKKNFTSFFTFVISTILFNTLANGNLVNVFTAELTVISFAMLIVSAVYLTISLIEMNDDIKKLDSYYDKNKKYYSSILNDQDIERLFDDDESYDDDKTYMKKQRKLICILWVFSILAFGITLFLIGDFSIITGIFK
ncbi:hypothetical protein P7D95_16320 [Enterococcus avium]|uniref:hypothetical protein n=1 Tax=Enterococcus avium TaxID=33945 RepID=UPI002891231A|nr:hypothetical protein [Enterococcus avium]MDT2502367.1 hypothetical protein [Enterococcus avium]